MRSAWRGEARIASEPKRARSTLEEAVCIISIAQQARPNCAGQTELPRPQPTSLSSVVSSTPGMLSASSSSPMVLVPLQAALPPDVGERDHQDQHEDEHLDHAVPAELAQVDGPGIEEDRLDVEDDEEHRGQVEAHRQPLARRDLGDDARLVGQELALVRL